MAKVVARLPHSPLVPPCCWGSIEAGEWMLVKLHYSNVVFLLQVLGNPIGLPESPCLTVAFAGSQCVTILRYHDLQRLKRYRGLLPLAAH